MVYRTELLDGLWLVLNGVVPQFGCVSVRRQSVTKENMRNKHCLRLIQLLCLLTYISCCLFHITYDICYLEDIDNE
jgi:hypothetical protein